jgi:DNA-binding response OmpR family regulator
MPARNPHDRRPVLVIESDAALRRVLTVGLRRQGMRVIEAHSLGAAWDLVTAPPAAVVLDVGLGPNSEWVLLGTLRRHRVLSQAPLVVLAWECPTPAVLDAHGTPLPACLTKPFDARALYTTVTDLVRAAAPAPAAAIPTPTESPRQPHTAASSFWPLVTAAGATLALTGLLTHVALVVIGIALLVAAALLWSSEAGGVPEPAPSAAPTS